MKADLCIGTLTFMFTLNACKEMFILTTPVEFALATNPALTRWTKPFTIREILYRKNEIQLLVQKNKTELNTRCTKYSMSENENS